MMYEARVFQGKGNEKPRETRPGDRKFLALSIQFTIQGKIVRPPFFLSYYTILMTYGIIIFINVFPMKNIYIFF